MTEIDEYSLSTIPVQQFFGQMPLGHATAFIWFEHGHNYLITNWHVVAMIDPITGSNLHSKAARPNLLRAQFNPTIKIDFWKFAADLRLRDQDGNPLWLIHPVHREKVDVVALPLEPPPSRIAYHPINRMKSVDDLAVAISMDVFVLGYPFDFRLPGFPIWKRGSIASEPELAAFTDRHFIIDSATRPGMSGGPVVLRSWGVKVAKGFITSMHAGPATKFLGVYSGRLPARDLVEAQLGMVWPAALITEIIGGGKRDDVTL